MTDLPLDVANLVLSPDGTELAFTMEVFPDCETLALHDATGWRSARSARRRARSTSGCSSGTGTPGRTAGARICSFALSTRLLRTSRAAVDVMPGMDADCPSKPFGGPEEFTFTPDGSGLVFTARDVGAREAWSTDFDLYQVPADGSAPPRCLTEENEAWDTQPVFSPDGKTLAYLAMERPGLRGRPLPHRPARLARRRASVC